jgi:hypothetical protein
MAFRFDHLITFAIYCSTSQIISAFNAQVILTDRNILQFIQFKVSTLHEAGPSPRPQIAILHSIYTPDYKLRVPAHTQFSQIDVDREVTLAQTKAINSFARSPGGM